MKEITLNNGAVMPMIGLGTAGLKGDNCVRMVEESIRLGYRLVDTARMYGNEEEVGEGIRRSGILRDDLFVTTKICSTSNSYEKAVRDIEDSLKRLRLDHVDLLLLHEPYPEGMEMYKAMIEACEAGKTRSIGISNYQGDLYDAFVKTCPVVPAVNQLECHLLFQKNAMQEKMKKRNICFQAWSPLAQGKGGLMQDPVLKEIASIHGKTPAQIQLHWLIQRGISVLPRTSRVERLKENVDILDFELSEREMEILAGIDTGKTLFPWTEEF